MRVDSIIDLIGNTPLIRLRRLSPPGGGTIFAKAEFLNPMGSVKDRPAKAMIEAAEQSGALRPGMTLIEPTSGNTGVGLAAVARMKGYNVMLLIQETEAAAGVLQIARALGAEIRNVDSFESAVDLADRLRREEPDRYFVAQQFRNPANPQAHRQTTGPEIIADVGPELKAFVCGSGSGGTFTGIGQALKRYNPDIRIILVEPDTVPLFSRSTSGLSQIYGIGPPFIPEVFDRSIVDEIIQVTEQQANETMRLLARSEALLCGQSAGAFVHCAIQVASRYRPEDVVVTILPDRGERYFADGLFNT